MAQKLRGKSIFFEKVEVLDLSLFKFGDKEKDINVSDIKCTLGELKQGETQVEFMCEDVLVFKLSFAYDPETKSGLINSILPVNEGMEPMIAAVLNEFMVGRPDLVSLRSGFGDMGKVYEILTTYQFPALIRIQITSMDKRSIAITKSISKLQESFVGSKFSLTRLA